jgi:UDP-galactopyranose mutase
LPDSDYLIVGSGLTGSTVARMLADRGNRVAIIDRRRHLGGNVHDWIHTSGIRVHTYGPHYFRTSSDRIWKFVTRFSDFYPYAAVLKARVNNRLLPWPITHQMAERCEPYDWRRPPVIPPENFEDAILNKMPVPLYRTFVRDYTRKQWGVPPARLSADLAKRVDLRDEDDPRLKTSKHQSLPTNGYAAFMKKLLEGIPVSLGIDFARIRSEINPKTKIVYTGPIDEFFNFDIGRLAWRGQKRRHIFAQTRLRFPVAQVNFPTLRERAIRVIEWAHLMPPGSQYRGTVLTYETPYTPTDPAGFEYPFPDQENRNLYALYRRKADALRNVTICGRLGEYRYYDMDQAIGRAMEIARHLLEKDNAT